MPGLRSLVCRKGERVGMRFSRWLLTLFITISVFAGSVVAYASVRRAEVLRKVAQSTVVIFAERSGKLVQGSGTVLGKYGEWYFIVTCNHVIEGASRIVVAPTKHDEDLLPAFVEMAYPSNDLALLVVKDLALPVLSVAPREPQPYETVYAVGAPHTLPGTASEGIVADAHYELDKTWFYRITNAYIDSGISGGTATNVDGEFIGVPAQRFTFSTQVGLLVPRALVLEAFGPYLKVYP